jgi:hypothetical protein
MSLAIGSMSPFSIMHRELRRDGLMVQGEGILIAREVRMVCEDEGGVTRIEGVIRIVVVGGDEEKGIGDEVDGMGLMGTLETGQVDLVGIDGSYADRKVTSVLYKDYAVEFETGFPSF